MTQSKDWTSTTAQYSSKCIECNESIKKFSIVLWKKGMGIKHELCLQKQESSVFVDDNTPKIWNDVKKYSYPELQKITKCQCCGNDIKNEKDSYIDDDRKVCIKCFSR